MNHSHLLRQSSAARRDVRPRREPPAEAFVTPWADPGDEDPAGSHPALPAPESEDDLRFLTSWSDAATVTVDIVDPDAPAVEFEDASSGQPDPVNIRRGASR